MVSSTMFPSDNRPASKRCYRPYRARRSRSAKPRALPYTRKQSLLSQGEAAFHRVLCDAVSARWLVMCKVRLADIVYCSSADWLRGHGGKISQKHLDFVLCDPRTSAIVLAVELDDRTHDAPERRARDRFVDEVLATAGVRLLRVRARSTYETACIDRFLNFALSLSPQALARWNQRHVRHSSPRHRVRPTRRPRRPF